MHVDRLIPGTVTLGAGMEDRSQPQEPRGGRTAVAQRYASQEGFVCLAHWWLRQGLCPLHPHSS